ncbi:MAG: hypothetical protein GDA36_03410 [Rhodobacteraceae bacterium]|nr:hypothetical protein [Paracoccaceae bacterium]
MGDASVSPDEITYTGGAIQVWRNRARDQWISNLWINLVPENTDPTPI